MAAITPAEVETVLNQVTSTPSDQGDLPVFTPGDEVFYLADEPAAGSNLANTPKYTIVGLSIVQEISATVTKWMDQTRTYATPADGTSARSVTGFQHDDTTGAVSGVSGATTTSRPWFYDIQDVTSLVTTRGVHQAQLTNEAGWEAYIATKLSTIFA
jgi:hypothetical protein